MNRTLLGRIESGIDRFSKSVSPSWYRSRVEDRFLASVVGGYDSASTSSSIFQEFITSITDADSSVNWADRERLIERSRDIIRNSPIAKGIICRICDHAIGAAGLQLHPAIDAKRLNLSDKQQTELTNRILEQWALFSESKDVDLYRESNFAELNYLTLQSELEGGDCFTLLLDKTKATSSYNLTLQSLEGEFVSNPQYTQNTSNLVHGVQKNTTGVPISYWFSKYHSGNKLHYGSNQWTSRNIYGQNTGKRVILHHYQKIRLGQTRGIPLLAPILGKLLQLNRYSKAELLAAVLNSFYTVVVTGPTKDTVFTKKSPRETETLTEDDKLTMGSGSVIRAKDGSIFEAFDPKRPNTNYTGFAQTITGEVGSGIGVPKSAILMSYDKSYSASRGEGNLAWMTYMGMRLRSAMNFCQPVYESFFDEAVAKGIISAPGYFQDESVRKAYVGSYKNQWSGPTKPAIDELREAKAFAVHLHELETMSRTEITSKTTGRSWDRVSEERKREEALLPKEKI